MGYLRLQAHQTTRFLPLQRLGDPGATTLHIPGYRQTCGYSCGFACALMVLRYYRLDVHARDLFRRLGTGRDGTRQYALVRELRALGVRANVRYDVGFPRIRQEIDRDKLIVSYLADADHWIVIYGYAAGDPERIYVADPRPGEACEHLWERYGPRLRQFGIVCSRARADTVRPAVAEATDASPDGARAEPGCREGPVSAVQLSFDFGRP